MAAGSFALVQLLPPGLKNSGGPHLFLSVGHQGGSGTLWAGWSPSTRWLGG